MIQIQSVRQIKLKSDFTETVTETDSHKAKQKHLYHMVVVDIFVQIGLVGNMGYVVAVYAIAVLCALISHYLVDDTVAHIFNKKKPYDTNTIRTTNQT